MKNWKRRKKKKHKLVTLFEHEKEMFECAFSVAYKNKQALFQFCVIHENSGHTQFDTNL